MSLIEKERENDGKGKSYRSIVCLYIQVEDRFLGLFSSYLLIFDKRNISFEAYEGTEQGRCTKWWQGLLWWKYIIEKSRLVYHKFARDLVLHTGNPHLILWRCHSGSLVVWENTVDI